MYVFLCAQLNYRYVQKLRAFVFYPFMVCLKVLFGCHKHRLLSYIKSTLQLILITTAHMLIANVVHYDAATISKFVQFNRRSYESGRGTTTSVNEQQNERASVFQSCAPSDGRAKKLDIRMI